jgi:hypothetical protein
MDVKKLIAELSKLDHNADVKILVWGRVFSVQEVFAGIEENKNNVVICSELWSGGEEEIRNTEYMEYWG